MRILLINNFFHDVGGVERVFFLQRELLQSHGHIVIDFSTRAPENKFSEFAPYFVSDAKTFLQKSVRAIWSREVDRALSALIEKTKPDVVHIHGIFDALGPTVLWTLRRHHIKIIFTAHAYKLICPNWKLFSHDHIDELCGNAPLYGFNDVISCSVQNSFIKSFGAWFGWTLHRRLGAFNFINQIISPSKFVIEKHVARGWRTEKFVHIPNPVDADSILTAPADGSYILFIGRLVPEKGIAVLCAAAEKLPHAQFQIIGDGPVPKKGPPNVAFVGDKSPEDVIEYVRGAAAVVVPSIWYENDSLVVLESQAAGKIVVASAIGGIPEQIINGETGYLFPSGDSEKLAEILSKILATPPRHVGAQARRIVLATRDPELYYEQLMSVLSAQY